MSESFGVSQEVLAERAEIHRTQFSLLENGERMPLVLTFVKICGALGLSPDQLLGGIRWEPASFGNGSFVVPSDEVWKA